MLNDLLEKYAATQFLSDVKGNDSSQDSIQILKKIENLLIRNDWKITSSSIENNSLAMMAFFEMYARGIGGDVPALLCYYYSTLVANDNSLPAELRYDGNRFRAFITYKNMDKWDMLLSMARAPFNGYEGNLDNTSFIDILLLSDVYKAWDLDPSDSLLDKLKRQAPKVAAMHPTFSRGQVMYEGELAHKAVYNIVKSLVKKY